MARRARKSRAGLERWKQLVECLRLMNFAFNNVRLYPPAHASVTEVIGKLQEGLMRILKEQDDVGFGFMDEMLYVEGAMSIEETNNNQNLVDRLAKCRVKYLTISKTVTKEHLLGFFQALNDESKKTAGADPPAEVLARRNITSMHVVEAEVSDTASKSKLARRTTLLDWYEKAINVLQATQQQLMSGKNVELKPIYRLADDLMATIRTKGYEPFLLLPIFGIKMDQHLTHAVNVAIYACSLGELHGLNSGQIQTLCVAALLHDTGRCVIPPEWITDPAPLSLFERAAVHQHTSWGFLLLTRNEEIPPQVALLAAHHHANPLAETADGGYGPDIFHKIINLADAYDLAAFSDTFYWRKQRRDRVLKSILRKRGQAFEPLLAKLLAQLVGYYPVGSLVTLEDGQRGMVVRNNPDSPARPKVYLFDAAPPEPVVEDAMDLKEGGLEFVRSVAGVLGPEAGLDSYAILDKKKEYLLNFSL